MLGMVGRGYGVAGMLRMVDEGWIPSKKAGNGGQRVVMGRRTAEPRNK